MVPPPATGDEFPDFENMTPEEQMAWLESLAKRQGVNEGELTTAADMEIDEVSPDAVIDEPGYTPFEGSVSARRMKEEAEAAAQAALESELVSEDLPEYDPGLSEEPEYEPAMADVGDAADPMQWLDGLSAQPGEEFGELEDVFADVSGWEDSALPLSLDVPEESVDTEPVPSDAELLLDEPQSLEPALEGTLPESGYDDPLGGMDPMLFLETLAKKQGVDQSELTTTADMEIAEVSPDAVVDEPGYTPFEGSVSARRMKEEAEAAERAAAESEPMAEAEPEEPEVELPLADEVPSSVSAEVSAEDVGELLDGADEMTWLESLARRQGADAEELLTSANLDVPELPEDTIIDEPGYVEYSPFGILSSEDDVERIEVPEPGAEDVMEDSALSWLEDLASEPDDEFSELFAEVDELGMELAGEEDAGDVVSAELLSAPSAEQVSDDPLAGMTDEDIARAQARGELTPQQELEWLKRQAAGLASARDAFPELDEEGEFEEVELEPAQPGEMPPWLLQMRDESDEDEPAAADLFVVDEIATDALEPAELPGLFEGDELVPDFDVSELALDTDELSPADVDTLWADEPVSMADELPEASPDSELAAFIKGDLVPEPDPLAEALDAEYERKVLGDDTEPEWYLKAKEQVEAGALAMPEAEAVDQPPQADDTLPEPAVAPAEPVDMPDWLKEKGVQVPAAQADDMPDWLAGRGQEEPLFEGDMPDWLAEEATVAESDDMPGWLADVEADVAEEAAIPWEPEGAMETPEPEAVQVESEPVRVPSPPVPSVALDAVQPEVAPPAPPVIPEGELFAQYRQRLEADPHDHASRLALARALLSQDQVNPSLDQYEALIQSSHLLQDAANDLLNLANVRTDMPRVRRLLGDTYMRQGRLQEALDAYRSALNQL